MKRLARVALAFVAIAGSMTPVAAQAPLVTGTITYRERIALSPAAVVDVRLEDVSRPEGSPPVVAQVRIEQAGQVPIKFELPYEARLINVRGRYAVRATIHDQGVDLFASLDTTLVLTQGRGTRADLTLTRIGTPKPPTADAPPARAPGAPPKVVTTAGPSPAAPLPPHPFTGFPLTFAGSVPGAGAAATRWHLNLFGDDSFFLRTSGADASKATDQLGSWSLSTDRRVLTLVSGSGATHSFQVVAPGTLRAMDAAGQPGPASAKGDLYRAPAYRPLDLRLRVRGSYMPGPEGARPMFVECATGQRWIVAQEGAAADLAKAYASARLPMGVSVIAEVDAAVADRSPGDAQPISTLVVNSVGRLLPKESCAPRFTAAPLTETAWRLTHMGDRAIPPNADSRLDVGMTFQAGDDPSSGSYAGSTGCNRLIGTFAIVNAGMTLTPGGNLRSCKEQTVNADQLVTAFKAVRSYRIAGAVLELLDEKGQRVARFAAR